MVSDAPMQDSRSPICFVDRLEAGERLAEAVLAELQDRPVSQATRFLVYALPRGGLPIAVPIVQQLACPLSVVVAKKMTRPENPELAIGAVTMNGQVRWLERSPAQQAIPDLVCELAQCEAQKKAQTQWEQLAPYCPRVDVAGAIALIVDDGIATGMTIAVAAQALRAQQAAEVWLCVPVAPLDIMPSLNAWGDRVIVLATPHPFYSVSRFYKTFPQVQMEEAIALLRSVQQSQNLATE
jgi:putative phosphoribosyl transferase